MSSDYFIGTLSGYIAFHHGKRVELFAMNLLAAKMKVVDYWKIPKSKQGLLSVVLAQRIDGSEARY